MTSMPNLRGGKTTRPCPAESESLRHRSDCAAARAIPCPVPAIARRALRELISLNQGAAIFMHGVPGLVSLAREWPHRIDAVRMIEYPAELAGQIIGITGFE